MIKERFAENLKFLMGDKSISCVAKGAGMPPQTLNRYLLCQREIGLENLVKIADYFGVDLDFLTGRKA